MSSDGWTIDELAQRVTATLAELGVQAPSGRVTAVPDRRLIRWYATIGLLDRPLPTRGRVARYGERHLLQLVAVKRRQAEGRSLAEIQAELAGATDAVLRRAAGLPATATAPAARGAPSDQDRDGFWRATPDTGAPVYDRPPFAPVSGLGMRHPTPDAPRRRTQSVPPVYPVPLHDAATLVLHVAPTPDDLAALRAAARPLLDLLAARGLLPPPSPSPPLRPAPRSSALAPDKASEPTPRRQS